MAIIVIIEKTNHSFSRFVDLLKSRDEVRQAEVYKVVARSSYFGVIMKRVFNLNKVLREIDSNLFFAEPSFSISSTDAVYASIKKCPLIEIESRKEAFIVRCKIGKEKQDYSDSGKQRSISTHPK